MKNIAIFAGAGISYNSPSNLPLGSGLAYNCLSRLVPKKYRDWTLSYLKRSEDKRPGEFLRFESLMYGLRAIDRDYTVLDCLSQCQKPNLNHFILAKLVTLGVPVITTNFDTLIEQALALIPSEKGKNISVAVEEKDFLQAILTKDGMRNTIWKIHGSFTEDDSSSKIQATYTNVLSNRIESPRTQLLSFILKHFEVVFVGYSGSDDLDLMPYICHTESLCPLTWVNHGNGTPRKINAMFDPPNGMAHHFIGTDLLKFNCTTKSLRPITWIEGDTNQFLRTLLTPQEVNSLDLLIDKDSFGVNEESYFDDWYQKLQPKDIDRLKFTKSINQLRNGKTDREWNKRLDDDIKKYLQTNERDQNTLELLNMEYNEIAERRSFLVGGKNYLRDTLNQIESLEITDYNSLYLKHKFMGSLYAELSDDRNSSFSFWQAYKLAQRESDFEKQVDLLQQYFYYYPHKDQTLYGHYVGLCVRTGTLPYLFRESLSMAQNVLIHGSVENSPQFPYTIDWDRAMENMIYIRRYCIDIGDTMGEDQINTMLQKLDRLDEANKRDATLHWVILKTNVVSLDKLKEESERFANSFSTWV